jgi:hypothetical protein
MSKPSGLLVKVRGSGESFAAAATRSFGAAAIEIEPILTVPPPPAAGAGIAAAQPSTWLRIGLKGATGPNPWDDAHALMTPGSPFAVAGVRGVEAVEPDLVQDWLSGRRDEAAADTQTFCSFDDQSGEGGKATGPELAWNLAATFSELADARAQVGGKTSKVLVAHLDTGFDPRHITTPVGLQASLQRNFVRDDGDPNDASDQTPPGQSLFRNRGHGTGTLSLLAGNKLDGTSPSWPGFKDFVGGAPNARVIPVRIANWVVRFSTSTMVQGFDYARAKGAHVLSMSMGGVTSQALVDAINLAYDAGIVMVTAAGNNIAFVPTPKSIVFPARYRRVLAACGVMADGRAYAGLSPGTMQGNYGPASKMDTALGAYTPNVPWAQIDCAKVVDMDGAGTSAATPQIAAAAALWLAEHFDTVMSYSKPWMRVEAVRHALFKTAAKSTAAMGEAETREKIGRGVVKAHASLAVKPPAENTLTQLPPAQASWPWLDLIFGGGVSIAPPDPARRAMLSLELTQIAQKVPAVDAAINDPERPIDAIAPIERNRYLEAVLDEGDPSKPLRRQLEAMLGRSATAVPVAAGRSVKRKLRKPPMPRRRLRVYALDPSVAKSLESIAVNETTLSVRWDDTPEAASPLLPGPVGEYLEVIDVDPASNRVYEPVDLNDRALLAQDGWPPSEGNPKFHQQMVYAVAMTTIEHFERALGRPALWAPRWASEKGGDGGHRKAHEVPRLRIYPHALRTNNAYYSPDKKALLFGYFPSESNEGDATTPGSMVFTCLSSDIIAHETSHALLDGLHRRFQEASNPDVPAFHEAFADIVALFQHFTVTELVRFEIGRVRDLSAAKMLAGLAQQFGEGSSKRGPLRNYLDPAVQNLRYEDTRSAHDRGSILVFAIYDAFRAVVAHRTADLIRLATGGSGVLPAGALHPDLVNRLTEETCDTAQYVLHMCIRALDYCPAVDITFGEYLRALITADMDLVPVDRYGYRVAFMEAFRKRGILPKGIRTVSEETLAWGVPEEPSPAWLPEALEHVDLGLAKEVCRSQMFALHEKNRWTVWRALDRAFKADKCACGDFGLQAGVARFDGGGKELKKPDPGGTTFEVFNVRPARRLGPDGSFRTEVIITIQQRRPVPLDGKSMESGWFWFRGGTTLIVDPRKGREKIRYGIVKHSDSEARLERQRQHALGHFVSPLRALYFNTNKPGEQVNIASEPFALMHAAGGENSHG